MSHDHDHDPFPPMWLVGRLWLIIGIVALILSLILAGIASYLLQSNGVI